MSLRTRLILSYFFIVVLCLGIAAISVDILLQNNRDQVNISRLEDITRPIFVQIRAQLRSATTAVDIWASIEEQAQRNNVFILFVDNNGNLVRQASPQTNSPTLSAPDGLPHFTQQAHGIFTADSGEKYVYVAYPVTRGVDPLAARPETVVLCQPRSSIVAIMTGLITPFIWAGIIALVISLLLAFFVARSVYKPINQLSKAAANISRGQYDQEVPVAGPPEIKGLADSFNNMARKVKDSQQQLRHFVADVSHQLKSPLTSIQGFAQAMLDGTASDNATRTRATQIIVDESQRMIRQVNELLELSRMQSGQAKMVKEPVDIKEILQRCEEIFALRLEEKNIRLESNFDSAGTVTGDADRLEDVFCNLLDNAIKNTPDRGEIRLEARNGHDHTLEVTISDTGPGIPPEQLPYVFERFQQTSGLRTGFGLGLAIARAIVLAHGGKIEVFSNPGEGAKFTVTLKTDEKK